MKMGADTSRLKRTVFMFFFSLTMILPACEEENTKMVYELKEADDLPGEVYEVYSRLLDDHFEYLQYAVVRQETDTAMNRLACHALLESDTTSLSDSILENYLSINQASKNLGFNFDTIPPVKLITEEELNSYETWDNFHSNYNMAKGVILLTLPGFDQERSGALFEYAWRAGNETDGDYLVYMERMDGEWEIVVHEPIDGVSSSELREYDTFRYFSGLAR